MKNTLKQIGIIALIAVIGLFFAGCKNGTTDSAKRHVIYSGTAGSDEVVIIIAKTESYTRNIVASANDYYTVKVNGTIVDQGRITTSDSTKISFRSVDINTPPFYLNLGLTVSEGSEGIEAKSTMSTTAITMTQGGRTGEEITATIESANCSDLQGKWYWADNKEQLIINGNIGESWHRRTNGNLELYAKATINFNGETMTAAVFYCNPDFYNYEDLDNATGLVFNFTFLDKQSIEFNPPGEGIFIKQK